GKGFIQFGTEVVNSEDHSVIALLGESPGASTHPEYIVTRRGVGYFLQQHD
ncbi:malate:quinone oxidoreductase, partial [Staphylococcus pasteuri]|uniref:malate:quinone oxidoreductase n=1 Tax=Staphylococcus pasteuri TaxID=45972 RepID=UPI003CFC4E9D